MECRKMNFVFNAFDIMEWIIRDGFNVDVNCDFRSYLYDLFYAKVQGNECEYKRIMKCFIDVIKEHCGDVDDSFIEKFVDKRVSDAVDGYLRYIGRLEMEV
jgi:hypothetical protein